MKTTTTPKTEQDAADELRPEYNLDYRKARPNRFAGQVDKSQVVVMPDADISDVFTTPESVNGTFGPIAPKHGTRCNSLSI